MATTEPLTGAPIPTQSDGPLGGLQIAAAVKDIADNTIPYYATASARDTAFSAWVTAGNAMRNGLHCHVQGVGDMVYEGGQWLPDHRQRFWTFGRTGNVSDTFASGSFVVVLAATIANAPAGDYAITSRLVISNSVQIAGFQRTTANDVSISTVDPRADAQTSRLAFTQTGGYTHAGGSLTVKQFYDATGGSPTVHSQGTEIAVFYLGPR